MAREQCAVVVRDMGDRTDNIRVIRVDTALLAQALDLYQFRPDKDWGLTDGISFIVMQRQDLVDVVTSDRHFRPASFHIAMT